MKQQEWMSLAAQTGCDIVLDEPLCRHTSFQIGGPADALITAPDAQSLAAVYAALRQQDIPVRFLGNGSNLLVDDAGVRGAVVRLSPDVPVVVDETRITCGAGTPLKRLCRIARDHALSGLEFAFGIPGLVGGAIYMNAGAYGGEIADALISASVLLPDGTVSEWNKQMLDLSYRHSALMEIDGIVVSATFQLMPGDITAIETQMNDYMKRRRDKQPLEYPSAGSYFKRPTGYFAGALIEQSDLKGFTVGGAQVSEKHAGFIINRDHATCADVLRLEEAVREKVYRDHGVVLEREVQYWRAEE